MGSGKSSLDNSQWRPNKRMAGIPRARDLPASLPRRRLSDRVIRASLAPLASRLARASRRLARRDERPRLRSRAALDRRARSPRAIDDARVDLPRNTIVFWVVQSKKSEIRPTGVSGKTTARGRRRRHHGRARCDGVRGSAVWTRLLARARETNDEVRATTTRNDETTTRVLNLKFQSAREAARR
jgi:hypothetical protein